MLYLDASALVKRYIREPGTDTVNARFDAAERIFTSVLSYAEVQAALAKKYHRRELNRAGFQHARERFVRDFVLPLHTVEVDTNTMAALPGLVERYPITGADAVHLSAALWLRDVIRLVPEFAGGDQRLEFGTADKDLMDFARASGLSVLSA